jgi:hypothetical protein
LPRIRRGVETRPAIGALMRTLSLFVSALFVSGCAATAPASLEERLLGEVPEVKAVRSFRFSPDGRRVAYVLDGLGRGPDRVVVDGVPREAHELIC